MNYNIEQYRQWLTENITLTDAYSPASLRMLTYHLLRGQNYRLVTEKNTKDKLLLTYVWLSDIVNDAKNEYGENWQTELVSDLFSIRSRTPEQKNLLYWLIGLTAKTSVNLGVSTRDIPSVMTDLLAHVKSLFDQIGRQNQIDDTWLLLMAGSATLNIRGSEKSKIGKVLEKVMIRSILSILGLVENVNFWINIDRDLEVDREADAEIATNRGRIRVEVGLISSGNQEVTEDKISRVGRNGIILFDKVGQRTRIYQTAERHAVKLVQIRNNQPLVEIYRHIRPLVEQNINLIEPPTLEQDIWQKISELPDQVFSIEGLH
ncbi:CfrBI restriction endonuclease [Alistipes timonensis JC136]|uniref:CfrBI restriction endonuclease n=1 Tax=Alistipes timonensis JC136 TaxID=1033731 RepID=A0A1H4F236_9BACT|nr:CfrBI family restriction endonuclease [Alistipes timonensis]SEA91050.1 CfrBI restriction endonuclease [Alistipes timonensis JC136]